MSQQNAPSSCDVNLSISESSKYSVILLLLLCLQYLANDSLDYSFLVKQGLLVVVVYSRVVNITVQIVILFLIGLRCRSHSCLLSHLTDCCPHETG